MSAGNEPAFPRQLNENGHSGQPGLTRRAWIASQAPEPPATWWAGDTPTCAGYALWNYQYANAMITEGEKS